MKKAFSLVELTIVLIIATVLLTIVIKGRSLINNMHWRQDVTIINAMEASFLQMINTQNSIPDTFDLSKLADQADMKMDELINMNNFIGKGGTDSAIQFIRCKSVSMSGSVKAYEEDDSSASICLLLTSYKEDVEDFSKSKICYLENLVDNSNANTGEGLMMKENRPASFNINYRECPIQDYKMKVFWAKRVI